MFLKVSISVNGKLTDLKMKLGGAGEAFFSELDEDNELLGVVATKCNNNVSILSIIVFLSSGEIEKG